jgi:hypothetical protein
MSSGGAVTGVVRRGDGTPLPGAKLTLSHRSIGYLNEVSDAEGRYRFDQLPANLLRPEVQESSGSIVRTAPSAPPASRPGR